MQYYLAIRQGELRARQAQEVLVRYIGIAMPAMMLKAESVGSWEPVGEENLVALIEQGGTAVLALCDGDGNAKTLSRPMPVEQARDAVARMKADGLPEFKGTPRLPV
jgi:hypothetical protein